MTLILFEISFLGIKKITLKEKYVFITLDVQLELYNFTCGDIHRGICAINWAELRGIKSHGAVLFPIIRSNMAEWRRKCLFMTICLMRVSTSHLFLQSRTKVVGKVMQLNSISAALTQRLLMFNKIVFLLLHIPHPPFSMNTT